MRKRRRRKTMWIRRKWRRKWRSKNEEEKE